MGKNEVYSMYLPMTFKRRTYREWVRDLPEDVLNVLAPDYTCPDCGGSGSVKIDCGQFQECSTCWGAGHYLYPAYMAQVDREDRVLKKVYPGAVIKI